MTSRFSFFPLLAFLLALPGAATADTLNLDTRLSEAAHGYRDGKLAQALFNRPQGLTASSDALVVADTFNHCLRRVDFASGTAETLAGHCGEAGRSAAPTGNATDFLLDTPVAVVADPQSDGYLVLDAGNRRIVRIHGGTADELSFSDTQGTAYTPVAAYGLAMDPDGRPLLADGGAHSIMRLDLTTLTAERVAGTGVAGYSAREGTATTAVFDRPSDLAYWRNSHGNYALFVADSGNDKLRWLLPNDNDGYYVETIMGVEEGSGIETPSAAPRLRLTRPYRLAACEVPTDTGWRLLITLPLRGEIASYAMDGMGSILYRAASDNDVIDAITCLQGGAYAFLADGSLAALSFQETTSR